MLIWYFVNSQIAHISIIHNFFPHLHKIWRNQNLRFGLVYGIHRHFQQYFSYIMVGSLLVEETRGPGEYH